MPEKGKLYVPDFFPASTKEKTAVGAGKMIPLHMLEKVALCAKIFPASTVEKTAVDARKNGTGAYRVFFPS